MPPQRLLFPTWVVVFAVVWGELAFTGCKYTKSAVQIGHEPHFSSLLPYFAGFAARFRRPLCCPLPSSVSARPLAPLPFASAAPAPVSRPPASRPCSASLLCVPALRPCSASLPCVPARPVSPSPAPHSTLPVPAQLAGLRVSSSPSRRASCSSTVITRSVRAAIVRSSL